MKKILMAVVLLSVAGVSMQMEGMTKEKALLEKVSESNLFSSNSGAPYCDVPCCGKGLKEKVEWLKQIIKPTLTVKEAFSLMNEVIENGPFPYGNSKKFKKGTFILYGDNGSGINGESLFSGIEKLSAIRFLKLERNSGIKKLPNVLTKLPNLVEIDLRKNGYSSTAVIEVERDLWNILEDNGGKVKVLLPSGVRLKLSNDDSYAENNDRFEGNLKNLEMQLAFYRKAIPGLAGFMKNEVYNDSQGLVRALSALQCGQEDIKMLLQLLGIQVELGSI